MTTGLIMALAYNYPPEEKVSLPPTRTLAEADAIDANGSARELSIQLHGLPSNASFLIETLDRHHGDAIEAWERMGKPDPPNSEQTKTLRNAA